MNDYTVYKFDQYKHRAAFIKFLINAYGGGHMDVYNQEEDSIVINLDFGKMLIEFKEDQNEIHVYDIKEGGSAC